MIHQAVWQPADQPSTPVAVKLYKGEMTSDGSPLHEMNACITAGLHSNLIRVEGRIVDHPQQTAGLVMQLIPPSFRNLASLPSLASCSRDIYPDDLRLSAAVALRIASGIASVAEHLHGHGITHGDLYGHNILWNEQGDCLLGTLARRRSTKFPTVWKAVPCNGSKCGRSGCCWELLARIDSGLSDELRGVLEDLERRCCQPQVLTRPGFSEVVRQLESL